MKKFLVQHGVEVLLFIASVLVFLESGGLFLMFADDLPPLAGIIHYGCTSFTLTDRSVRATAWADYDDEHLEAARGRRFTLEFEKENPHRGWARLVSVRSGKNADKKAAEDCVTWTRTMRQALQQNLKEKEK